jgi:hypothetical protein
MKNSEIFKNCTGVEIRDLRSKSELSDGLCAKCSGVADPPYNNFIGGPALCEKCACEGYKQTVGYLINKSGLLARDVIVKNPSA